MARGVRVKINVQHDADDENNLLSSNNFWFYINAESTKTIAELATKLRERFSLPCIRLFLQDFLLLSDEPIDVLKDGDLIVIRFDKKDCNFSKNSSLKENKFHLEVTTTASEIEFPCVEDLSKKQKKLKRKHKERKSEKLSEKIEEMPAESNMEKLTNNTKEKQTRIDIIEEHLDNFDLMKLKKTSSLNEVVNDYEQVIRKDNSATNFGNSSDAMDLMNEETVKNPKKKRRRKRKSTKSDSCDILNTSLEHSTRIPRSHKQEENIFKPINGLNHPCQHIRFDESLNEDNLLKSMLSSETKINEFYEHLETVQENHKEISSSIPRENIVKRKASVPPSSAALSNFLTQPISRNLEWVQDSDNTSSEVEDIIETRSATTNGLTMDYKHRKKVALPITSFHETEKGIESKQKKDYNQFPDLQGPPRAGDRLAFQELILSESYSPEISAFRTGTVQAYDSDDKTVLISLDEPVPAMTSSGKFSLEENDQKQEIFTEVSLHLLNILNPKLIT